MPQPSDAGCLGDLTGEREAVLRRNGDAGLTPSTAAEYLASLDPVRFASLAYRGRPAGARPFVQPRGGFPSVAKQRVLTVALDEAGADFLPLTVDSHTRHNDYRTASELLALGLAQDRDLLNGYPLVSHGVRATRTVFEGIARPISLRHGTPDARLLAEIALACGITEIEGGGLSYTLPYARSFPLSRALAHWQYVDRLCAVSGPAGAPVHRESFGPLTATLVPPVTAVCVQLCELLLAAEQGVRSFAVSFGQSGSFEQDVATARVLRTTSRALLDRFGFHGVDVRVVYHQWMGAFPADAPRAWQLIAVSAAISRFAGADKVVVKTPEEAVGVPAIETNAAAVRAVRYVLDMFPHLGALSGDVIDEEADLISAEVADVLDRVLDSPARRLVSAVDAAVHAGWIDVPFAPHEENAGRMVAGRGADRRVRILDPGAMPLSAENRRREQRLRGEQPGGAGPLWERMLDDIRIFT